MDNDTEVIYVINITSKSDKLEEKIRFVDLFKYIENN